MRGLAPCLSFLTLADLLQFRGLAPCASFYTLAVASLSLSLAARGALVAKSSSMRYHKDLARGEVKNCVLTIAKLLITTV